MGVGANITGLVAANESGRTGATRGWLVNSRATVLVGSDADCVNVVLLDKREAARGRAASKENRLMFKRGCRNGIEA